ncbi:probable phosphoglycerate mutase [Paraoerskovia marina]|uniref:Probable phosphoglycerate mutase n=1 Tax=Paraoerskovia marina TaxID=545619 RepID=A0A1H1S1N1_9CELL|nr:bifunctional RNase H/acid phosphatase [Paraoerskovia marina]SDS41861.1 probable phosphoglycerate mutase [Paraoerskovia marina]
MGRRHLVVEADGGSRGNPGPAGYGTLVRDDDGAVLAERAGYLGETTNNVAEYTALVVGLTAAAAIDPAAVVDVRMDSKLVVEQMSGRWKIKHEDMRRLAERARSVIDPEQVRYTWIPRAENSAADALANEAMDTREAEIVRDFGDVVTSGQAEGGPQAGGGPRRRLDPSVATTLVLVRHGETALTERGAYSGAVAPGPALTSTGRIQAARAADLVQRVGRKAWGDLPFVSRIVASPLERAAETAAALGRRLGLHVRPDARLRECAFGDWESLTADEIDARWPGELAEWYESGTSVPPGGGESARDVGERVAPALAELVAAHPGASVAVVGHTIQIRAALGLALDVPPSRWGTIRLPPASVSILRVWPEGLTEVVAIGVPSDL